MKLPKEIALALSITIALMTTGCDEDRQLVKLAQTELERRANETQQLAEMHHKVQDERIALGQGRDKLEADRRQLATQRHRDPLIATAITSSIWLLVCALPLLVCWRVLQTPNQPEVDETVSEMLITDLVAEEPLLLRETRPALLSDSTDEPIS